MAHEELPKAILKKYPEIASIGDALDSYCEELPIAVYCPSCGQLLKVTEIATTDTLWVNCNNGCTNFRAKRKSCSNDG
ncbi:MAG TPA: hypothetical protein DCL61_07870 [Cyanobacteria bacterium UBA12227]|nr:hypothetical protein [Cyanobacteria bacterium UBA12227]HAX90507.1 hypothetical protein [Cyanobacteria bacterium UBA11370]HBY80239.1 hypothetical protein [Cyanobacteria bacterium UBA11148]